MLNLPLLPFLVIPHVEERIKVLKNFQVIAHQDQARGRTRIQDLKTTILIALVIILSSKSSFPIGKPQRWNCKKQVKTLDWKKKMLNFMDIAAWSKEISLNKMDLNASPWYKSRMRMRSIVKSKCLTILIILVDATWVKTSFSRNSQRLEL